MNIDIKCKLNCKANTYEDSKYCLKHLYWDDLPQTADLNNLSNKYKKINNQITKHISEYLTRIKDNIIIKNKRKQMKQLYTFLYYKNIYLQKHTKFKVECINKARSLMNDTDDIELINAFEKFINKYDL